MTSSSFSERRKESHSFIGTKLSSLKLGVEIDHIGLFIKGTVNDSDQYPHEHTHRSMMHSTDRSFIQNPFVETLT